MIDFMILGAQKAATSSLQNSLRKLKNVYMPDGESPFFEEPDYYLKPWATFPDVGDIQKINGIKRPDYLCSTRYRERIFKEIPKCKFIVVLREPIGRAISSYCYMVRHAHLKAKPLNLGIKDCIDDFTNGKETRAASVISFGLYGHHLNEWIKLYGKDSFLIISQEEVSTNFDHVLHRILAHIGLKPEVNESLEVASKESNVGLYDKRLLKIARIASIIKTKRIEGTYRREPRALPFKVIGSVLSKSVEITAGFISQQKEILNSENMNTLKRIYDDDLQYLKNIINDNEFSWMKK